MDRRKFLISTAGVGGTMILPTLDASVRPPTRGKSREVICTITMSGPSAGLQPFTLGHVLKRGDVPFGTEITTTLAEYQVHVRNRWPDGSARFAVISGVTPGGDFAVQAGGVAPAGPMVPEPPASVTVGFSNVVDALGNSIGGGSFSAHLGGARGTLGGAWSASVGHKVRELPGPVMSEFHYFVPTNDPHTHVWFYVRAYSTGHVEVETVVENGWLRVAGPGRRNYDVEVIVAGTQRFAGTISHYHHTRWSRVDWIGADPGLTPRHDVRYMQATGLVPAMAVDKLNATAYASKPESGPKYATWTKALAEQPQPFSLGNIDPALGAGGYTDNANLIAPWDSTWLVEGNPGAYWAMQGNCRSGGRFSVHYRDEATGGPARGSRHPQLGLSDTFVGISDNSGNAPQLTPAPTGGTASPSWYFTHGPSLGYLAYLTSGRWTAWEELQFYSSVADLFHGSRHNGFGIAPWWGQLREHAWVFRTRAQAAIVAPEFPDGVQLAAGEDFNQLAEARGRLDADIDYYHGVYVGPTSTSVTPAAQAKDNVFGLWYQNQDYDEESDGQYTNGGMMQFYNALAVMWAHTAGATTSDKLGPLAAFSARLPAGLLGAAAGGSSWDWRFCSFYQHAFATGGYTSPGNLGAVAYRRSWDEEWTFTNAYYSWSASRPDATPPDNKLRSWSPASNKVMNQGVLAFNGTSSQSDALIAVVAFAHEVAGTMPVPGMEAAASRFYGSDNWTSAVSGSFRDYAAWAYKSRRYGVASAAAVPFQRLPAWVPGHPGEAALVPMQNRLDDVEFRGVWSGDGAARFADFSGGAFNPYYGVWGAHVVHGGGHAASNDNSVFVADFNTLRFVRVGGPTQLPTDQAYETAIAASRYAEVADSLPGSAHTYDHLIIVPPSACGDARGGLLRPVSSAVGRVTSRGTGWSHLFGMTNARWTRWSSNAHGDGSGWSPGGASVLDTKRQRVWSINDGNVNHSGYLDLATRTWVNTLWSYPPRVGYPDNVFAAYAAHRDIIVIAACDSGDTTERLTWFAGNSNGSARNRATFAGGATLPAADNGTGSIVYVPELERLVYYTQATPDNYYLIDVPANPAGPWSSTRMTITGAARPSTLSPRPCNSTYHRFDYAPQLRSLVWVTAYGSGAAFGDRVVVIRIVP